MPQVVVVMGSKSDFELMSLTQEPLKRLDISSSLHVISAHRNPHELQQFISDHDASTDVFIAGAGMAAHLAGVIASLTKKPVIGVPIKAKALEGMDSLLSMVQMPRGVPVLTVGIDQSFNAGIAAAQIISVKDLELQSRLKSYLHQLYNNH